MNQSNRKTLFAIITFLSVGLIGVVIAFWLIDHPLLFPGLQIIIVVSLGIFLVSFIWAFLLFLRWRDGRRAIMSAPNPVLSQPELDGTIYGMIPGRHYQIMQSFADFYGNLFRQSEILEYKERHFLPYHGGHTIVFHERPLFLQEDSNKEILENFADYIALIKP